STAVQIINVDDNTPPLIIGAIATVTIEGCTAANASAAVTTVAALEALGLNIIDACTADAALVVTSSQTVTGTCPIVVTRTYVVTDACLNSSTAVQIINVDDNTPPLMTGAIATVTIEACTAANASAAVTTVAALEALGLNISDACTADAALVVTSSPPVTGTCPIVVTRIYVVTDACLNSSTAVQIINVDDNTAPVITGAIATVTIEGCTAANASAAVTTVAALEALGLSISDACTPDAALGVTSSQTVTGTCPIVVTRTYVVTDACLNSSTAVQIINVDDNTPPLITGAIATVTIEGCTAANVSAEVTTVADLETLGLNISDACTTDAALVVTSSQTVTGTCPIVVTRTYVVTDACLNSSTAVQIINVDDNTAPVITGAIATVTIEGCTAANASAAVTTVAALEALGLSISDACTPDAAIVVTSNQTVTGTCPIVVTRTYVVTDACLNSSTAVQIINVDDNTPPLITGAIATVTIEGCTAANASAAATTVAALESLGLNISDACTADAALVVTSSQTVTGTCPIVVTRTYVVTDACLNSSTAVQIINVDDNTPPLITGAIATVTIEGCTAANAS